MGKPPAFPLYASDFDMDTATWENDEIGAYLRLLLYEWVNGALPNDPYKLSKIVRESKKKFTKKWENLSTKFIQNGNGFLINKRMEEVREERSQFIESQREKGIKSAKKRWNGHITRVITMVKKRLQPEDNPSSSSSNNNKEDIVRSVKTKRTVALTDDDFIKVLKENPAYKGIDIDREIGKMDAWLLTPRGRGKKRTQQRLVTWLNRAEKPMDNKSSW